MNGFQLNLALKFSTNLVPTFNTSFKIQQIPNKLLTCSLTGHNHECSLSYNGSDHCISCRPCKQLIFNQSSVLSEVSSFTDNISYKHI